MHLHSLLLVAGGWVALITSLRVGIVRPVRQMLRKLEDLLALPDAVKDLTTTIVRYIDENERRLTRLEANMATVARVLRVRLLGDDDEPTSPT